jgi:4-diphosphocytidyl-2-C-methyl-D-erythritol kinase
MSGSGPTVFGLFEDKEVAMQAATVIKKEMKYKDVFVTELFQPNEKKGGR